MDDFFGTKVADPYRWLENSDAPDTRAWIDAENKVTFDYLSKIPERARIKARLTEIWNYERFGTPSREGDWYIYARNSGLQPQAVIYKAKALSRRARGPDRSEHAVEGRHGRARLHVVHRRTAATWRTRWPPAGPTGSSGASATSPPRRTCPTS